MCENRRIFKYFIFFSDLIIYFFILKLRFLNNTIKFFILRLLYSLLLKKKCFFNVSVSFQFVIQFVTEIVIIIRRYYYIKHLFQLVHFNSIDM